MRSTLSAFNEVWQCQFKQRLIQQLNQFQPHAKIVLGCSGGMDSMLLLHLLAELIPERLSVISIDHQLQRVSAAWSQFVHQCCEQYSISCVVVKVDVQAGNVEAQARAARYQAFSQYLQPWDVLVLAHHQQDQAETVMLRLLQGSGVRGLAAMCEVENRSYYTLWRPLLSLSKQHIQLWVQQLNICYVDDPMNHDMAYDRVWCRDTLWAVLQQRFPKMQDSIARCAMLMQDADDILQDVLQQDFIFCMDAQQRIELDKLAQLSNARQRQVLSVWMQAAQPYRPPLAMVQRLQQEVIAAREDAQSILHYADYYFVRFANQLYRYSEQDWLNFQTIPQMQQIRFRLGQHAQTALGQVLIQRTQDMGLDAALLAQPLSLFPRQGGEKIQFYARAGHRVLKKELQTAKIAPWMRHQIQILMYHNVVLGVFTPQGFWLAASPYCQAQGWLPYLQ